MVLLVGAGRFERPTPCAQGSIVGSNSSMGSRVFLTIATTWGTCFARQSTQAASIDRIRAQFCHRSMRTTAQKRSNASNASRYPMSIRHSSARTRKDRSQSAGGRTSACGSSCSCVCLRSNVCRNASAQTEASKRCRCYEQIRINQITNSTIGARARNRVCMNLLRELLLAGNHGHRS